jgi:hypothetical protein
MQYPTPCPRGLNPNHQTRIPTVIGVLVTPIFFFVVLTSTRAGHGSYLSFVVFYPISFLLVYLKRSNLTMHFLR